MSVIINALRGKFGSVNDVEDMDFVNLQEMYADM